MLEHRVGAVPVRECSCPQPPFIDCKKPPFMAKRWTIPDPVPPPPPITTWIRADLCTTPSGPARHPRRALGLEYAPHPSCIPAPPACTPPLLHAPRLPPQVAFRNEAGAPVDLYWHNGTCEELISWPDIGGVQPGAQKLIQSTHGHSFRIRSAADGHMLMQHTLDDLVVYGCDEEEARAAARSLGALATSAAEAQRERDSLAEDLSSQLARLILALKEQGSANATAHSAQYAVAADGAAAPATALQAGAARSLLGAGFTGLLKMR